MQAIRRARRLPATAQMVSGFLLIVILVMSSFLLSGCGSEKEQSTALQRVHLESMQWLTESGRAPFKEKSFDAPNDLALFKRALDESEPMNAKLDYAPMFDMTVTYVDGTSERYNLNIVQDANVRGLLVKDADTSQGYTIDMELSSELSKVIYGAVAGE